MGVSDPFLSVAASRSSYQPGSCFPTHCRGTLWLSAVWGDEEWGCGEHFRTAFRVNMRGYSLRINAPGRIVGSYDKGVFNILRTYQTIPHGSCLSLYERCVVDSDVAGVIRAALETPQTRWFLNDTRFLLTLWRPGSFRQRCPQIWCLVGRTPSWLVARLLLPVFSPRGRDTEALWASFMMTLIPSRGPPSPDLIVSPPPAPGAPVSSHQHAAGSASHPDSGGAASFRLWQVHPRVWEPCL